MRLMEFRDFLERDKIYLPSQILEIVHTVRKNFRLYKMFDNGTQQMVKVFNVPAAFDIEVYSGENDKGKFATMYVWSFCLYGLCIIGRTWDEFTRMMDVISKELKLSSQKRLIIYIHNEQYEFQFIRKWFEWENVFALDTRKPVYAVTTNGIEFRCSYILSGYSLQKVGEHLQVYKITKLVGDLDYSKPRNSKTILYPKEIAYCINDVKIVVAYIAELIEREGNITRIPLTKTSFVRRYCRNQCFVDYEKGKKNKRKKYRELIETLTVEKDEYRLLRGGFQGGFTHGNALYVGDVIEDVTSYDFTSSYPTVMIANRFPMSKGEKIDITSIEEFRKNLELYCCLFDIQFTNLRPKVSYENYLSESRCYQKVGIKVNNGRIVSGELVATTITDVDYQIIKKMYTWDYIKVTNFYRYKRGYLPTDFVKAILKLYEDKTKLKGVEGQEVEYLQSKEMLNSCYGMIVTAIVRDEIGYDTEWRETPPDVDEVLYKYNTSKNRILFYPWGVWVTAYARRNLFTGICEFAEDYIYSDTDSVKVKNAADHADYIHKYNASITAQLEKALDFHKIPHSAIRPKTIYGVEKPLGVWDFDGHYKRFKTLGAKRYMVQHDDGTYSMTVSGLNKKMAMPYMIKKYGAYRVFNAFKNDLHIPKGKIKTLSWLNKKVVISHLLKKYGTGCVFNAFNNDLYIPKGETGKNVHTYIDEEQSGILEDYMGYKATYYENSSVHLAPADYSLSLGEAFVKYFMSMKECY